MAEKLTKREEALLEETTRDNTTKVRGFRLDDETHDAFRKIAEKIGGNQQHVMAQLIATYEGQSEKNNLESGSDVLETFENYQEIMRGMMLDLLKNIQNAKILARADFAKQLESKDSIIVELQDRIKNMSEKLEESQEELKPLKIELEEKEKELENQKTKYEELENNFSKIQNSLEETNRKLQEELKQAKENDKNTRTLYENNVKIIVKLEDEISSLKKAESPIKENLSKVVSQNKVLITRNEFLEKENEDYKAKIEALKNSKEAEIQIARKQAVLETKDEMFMQIQSIREQSNKAMEKYLKLLEETRQNTVQKTDKKD